MIYLRSVNLVLLCPGRWMVAVEKTERNQSTYGILAMLSEGPRSGYEIKKILSEGEMFYWKESYGNIYPILRSLTDEGLASPVRDDSGRKGRICYELTDRGWDELLRWLEKPAALSRFRVELLMKLRFGTRAGIENMMSHIRHYRDVNVLEIRECDEILDALKEEGDGLPREVRALTVTYLRHFKEAILGWCDESLAVLDSYRSGRGSG
jgi:PadR family transcriptional regulator AphA